MKIAARASCSVCIVLLISCYFSAAQITHVTGDQTPPIAGAGHDYIRMFNETVNPANGAVSIRIGVPVPPGRRIMVPFAFGYDSNAAHHFHVPATPGPSDNPSYLGKGGWTYVMPQLNLIEKDDSWFSGSPPQRFDCYYFVDYMLTDLSGDSHALYISPTQPLTAPNCTGIGNPTVNGPPPSPHLSGSEDGFQAVTSAVPNPTFSTPPAVTAADLDGTVYYFSNSSAHFASSTNGWSSLPTWIEDRNGNKTTVTDRGSGNFTINDTLGRAAVSSSGFGATNNTITVSGLSNSYVVTWGSSGSNWTYSGQVTTDPGSTGTCGLPGTTYSVTLPEITAIKLPNGKSYTFQYDSTSGLLSKVIYPTGGYVRYAWGKNPLSDYITYTDTAHNLTCHWTHDTQAITDRFVSFDGTNEVLKQHFVYTTTWVADNAYPTGHRWSQKTTTVTTYDLVRGTTFDFATKYTYSPGYVPVQPNDPLVFDTNSVPVESKVQYYSTTATTGTPLRTVTKNFFAFFWKRSLPPDETVTLDNSQVAKTTHVYGVAQSCSASACASGPSPPVLRDEYEYDYGSGSPGALLRQNHIDYASFAATPIFPTSPSILDRPSDTITYDGSASKIAETDYSYDETAVGAVTATGHDDTNYPATYKNRGNATTVTAKCFQGAVACTDAVTTYAYDQTGQVTSLTDPNLNTTQFSFTDSFPPGNTNAYLTKITRPKTNSIAHVRTFSYAYADGQLTQSTDENSQPTVYKYVDTLGRLTETDQPDGGITTITYADTAPSPTITRNTLITTTVTKTAKTVLDGVGHTVQTQLSDPEGTDLTDFAYDGVGLLRTRSNPHRSTALGTDGTTTYTYDSLGRIKIVAEPDTSQTTTGYVGNATTVTDEAGKVRTSQVDALGRLTSLTEDPSTLNYITNYFYDALDRLTCVEQHGNATSTGCSSPPSSDATSAWRVRRSTYDSLHLLSASNPESGTIAYTYDVNGNVLSRTAPLPNQTGTSTVVTNYSYDPLNRLTQKAYVGLSTPSVQFGYDGAALTGCTTVPPTLTDSFPVGLRTSMCDGSGATSWSHDTMGRIATESRTIVGTSAVTKNLGYTYNLDGSVGSLTYPSGNVLTYTYGTAGRPLSAVDSANSINYVTQAQYWPHGALSSYIMGASATFGGITETDTYNNRLQPAMLSAGTTPQTVFSLSFGYGAVGHNNGNVMSIINNLDNTRNQTYTYDSLNRVATGQSQATAGTACWGQQFGYDAWGNLQSITGTKTGCSTLTLSANASIKNQLIGFGYDAAGNLTQEGSGTPSWTYTWDAENRLTTLAGSATARYTYDGDDQRAKMTGNGLFWRQPGGPFLSKSGLGGAILAERIYFQGKHIGIWHPGGSINYLVQDALGGEHIVTNATGAVCQDIDTLPFGSEIDYTSACDVSYKFAGIERDDQNSANLDYAINRYYNLRLGRFLTPDFSSSPDLVPFADLNDPRTLNQYGYVRNNPLAGTDVDGHGFWDRVKNCFMYGHCVTDEKIVQMAQQDRNWLKQNCITCYGKSGSDLDKLSNRQIISLYEQVQLDAQHGNVLTGTPPNVGTAPAGPMRTQWGWSGQQSYNAVVRKLNVPNTPEGTVNITEQELGGRLPTREEALRMIQDAGGRVLRDVETHPPGGVSTHTYPHINYETANGIKGAIKVQQ